MFFLLREYQMNEYVFSYLRKNMCKIFVSIHKGVLFGETFMAAHSLVSSAKRILSINISPCIPHDDLPGN